MESALPLWLAERKTDWIQKEIWDAKEWFVREWRREAIALAFVELRIRGCCGIHHAEDCFSEWLLGRGDSASTESGGRFDRALRRFDPEKGAPENFFLQDLRHYTVGTFWRRLLKQLPREEPPVAAVSNPMANPDRAASIREIVRFVLSRLGPGERDILLLNDQGYSVREIASGLGVSEANVKTTVHRARIRTREILGRAERWDETLPRKSANAM